MDNVYVITRDEMKEVADAVRGRRGIQKAFHFPDELSAEIRKIGQRASEQAVNFYGMDGVMLYSYTLEEAQELNALPDVPAVEGFIACGWNWTLDSIKAMGRAVDVGAVYAADDATRFYLKTGANEEITLNFSQTVSGGVAIDWGDGSETETIEGTGSVTATHTYASGRPVIRLKTAEGCTIELLRSDTLGRVLTRAELDRSVSGIGDEAFYEQETLSSIVIPDSVVSMGHSTFYRCYALKHIVIPDSVTGIGGLAFYACYALNNVVLPGNLNDIANRAFYQCFSLANIVIPDSVVNMSGAFYGCYALKRIVIPNGITETGGFMFYGCYALSNVVLPNSLTDIGENAFYNCFSLANIVIPEGVVSIGRSALDNCYSLDSMTVRAQTPPTLDNSALSVPHSLRIYVPAQSVDAYKTAENWSIYADQIEAIP